MLYLLLLGFPGDVGRDGEKGYPGLPAPKGNFIKSYRANGLLLRFTLIL